MNEIKIRLDIVPDKEWFGPRGGTRYMINRWVFERKTGRTIDINIGFMRNMELKDARRLKREILDAYSG